MNEKTIKIKKSELSKFSLKAELDTRYYISIVDSTKVCFFEIGDTLIRFNSGVLLPDEIEKPADGTTRPGLNVIAACLRYAESNTTKKMLIAGHTDTRGGDGYNVELSRIRAEAVHGMIAGDREQFAIACWGPHLTQEQRYPDEGRKKGVLWDDYNDVLNWAASRFGWPCTYPEGNQYLSNATVNFQKSYNKSEIGDPANKPIPEWGSFDKDTWRAVYDCYEVRLAEILETDLDGLKTIRSSVQFLNESKHYVTCGEYKPIDEPGRDNYISQTNRRVEVMFLDADENPAVPCFAGQCDAAACPIEPKNNMPIPVPGPGEDATGVVLRIRLHDRTSQVMDSVPYRAIFGGEISEEKRSVDGWADIRLPEDSCPESVLVEWGTPSGGGEPYQFKQRIYVECNEIEDEVLRNRIRLHNLGYQSDNDMEYRIAVAAFQAEQGIFECGPDNEGKLPPSTAERLEAIYASDCDATPEKDS